ncbi:MAG: DUF1292 domain-containing protein [Lachnospiraceae bacterium]
MQNPNNELPEDEHINVTLELDDGTIEECEIITIFEVNTQDYIALLPLDENDDPNEEGMIYLYRYFEDEEGNPTLENIEDDTEYDLVSEKFDELLDEFEEEE